MQSFFNLSLPKKTQKITWSDLSGSARALACAEASQNHEAPILIITPDSLTAYQLEKELRFFLNNRIPVWHFPDLETLPYDRLSPHRDIISQRIKILNQLPSLNHGIILVSIRTLMQRLTPRSFLAKRGFSFTVGQKIDIQKFRHDLQEQGYYSSSQVMDHGEFSIRGSIIDLFLMGQEQPFRIDLFDDEIDSIRLFDPQTQRSIKKVDHIHLLPAYEFSMEPESIDRFRENFRQTFDVNPMNCPIYQDTIKQIYTPGIEYYLPLFFENTESLFNYLPAQVLTFQIGHIPEKTETFWQDINTRYEQLSHDITRPILKPIDVFFKVDEILGKIKQYPGIRIDEPISKTKPASPSDPLSSWTLIQDPGKTTKTNYHFQTQPLPNITVDYHAKKPLERLGNLLAEIYFSHPDATFYHPGESQDPENEKMDPGSKSRMTSTRILFSVESEGRQEILINLLSRIQIQPKKIKNWRDFSHSNSIFNIVISPLTQGFSAWVLPKNVIETTVAEQHKHNRIPNPESQILCSPDFIIITENDLLGDRVSSKKERRQSKIDPENVIRNLTELKIGDPVVHINHGVGRFLGLKTIQVADQIDEYLTLEYANQAKLFVPIGSLDLISRYSGGEIEHAPLHNLGSKQWDNLKKKAAEKIHDVAAELLEIYAKRESKVGQKFNLSKEDYLLFSESFPFEETQDQETAITQVTQDMTSEKTMDRLICGDVGFGKTEVAMRAAFIAISNQKQVAVLAPTTLLAQQHFENFQDRFANWPVNIDMLSRFRTKKEQNTTLEKIKQGKVDIIIGTHRLLQKDIQFKNLGLLIIDEEHRFGVRQKETIKKLRADVDMLALTATPIPRTLNMAFSGVRDLSIIATPPKERLSIKTFIYEYEETVIKEAIKREIARGGQVYFLHNQVNSIGIMAETLQNLVPEARIGIGHGQMRERELEHVMADFHRRKFNLLLCTTIIENGIDIPSANTIIINNANRFGLAQLHQLRGRVGRSNRQAYAFLLVPSKRALNRDAKKRLEALSEYEDLGTGFTLATHDLEIRGAGELLGKEQSGHIQSIGFNLYMELLDRAVKSLKNSKGMARHAPTVDFDDLGLNSVEINLGICAIIPDTYVIDVHSRLILYKRIASCEDNQALDELKAEIIDRFGALPEPIKNLFHIAKLKLTAKKVGIQKIEANQERGFIQFSEHTSIKPETIIKLIQLHPKQYQFGQKNRLKFILNEQEKENRLAAVENVLNRVC